MSFRIFKGLSVLLRYSMGTLKANYYNIWTEIHSPLDQFEIRDLLSIDAPILWNLHFSLTNIGLYLIIGSIFVLIILSI